MSKQASFLVSLSVLVVVPLFSTGYALALPPAPPNDDPSSPEIIGPGVPLVVYGTTVLGDDSITTTGGQLPALDSYMDGPDVFYSFTPDASGSYRVHLLPWHHAPLRSSDRQFTIYIQDDADNFLAGARASTSCASVYFDATLTTGVTYRIGVDHNAATHDNFKFTLVVDTIPGLAPDDCATAEFLGTTVPIAALNDIDGDTPDYSFVQGTGRCSVAGTTPTTAPGIDHVYTFKPDVAGDYAIELVSSGFDGVLYVNTSCPPSFPGGCLGASNHLGKHELIVVTFDADTEYFIYVDNGSTTSVTGAYALIIDTAFAYEINEIEPNDDSASATPVGTPLNGGQLAGPLDEDWWAITGSTGDRVYAWVNNGGSSNSTLDTDLAFYATDGDNLIEFDDEDGDGIASPIEDLHYVYATSSPVLAGVEMTADGTHYLQVTDQNDTGTVHRYRFHVGVEPADRPPMPECEPNDTLSVADYSGKHYYAGVIDVTGDADMYAFEATVGDRVFVALDGDPERDATGTSSPIDDPKAFAAKLVVYDPVDDVLISDISDSNSIQSPPDYPAQGGFFVARRTGTYHVEVLGQSSSQVGAEKTYELAIFLNDAAPGLSEGADPILALTPDYVSDTIDVTATDNAPSDSGICSASLVGATNLQLTDVTFTPGDAVVDFTVALVNGAESGFGKLLVTDCAGNTACAVAQIDVDAPDCAGYNFSNRTLDSTHPPIHMRDNQPDGPGIDGEIEITESGLITDVNVTITIETVSPPDIDAFLISPSATVVELITDRGSSLAFDITDATFDDDAEEIMPVLSSAAPYTGTWLPEDPDGLAQLNGEDAMGTWILNVRDDSSSANGGARLARWTLDVDAGFAGPETFAGTASDTEGFDSGIYSIVLTDADNVVLNLPPDFEPGDLVVEYTVTLVDASVDGSGTITVTDMSQNTCQSIVSLHGLPDGTAPDNSGALTTDRTYGQEVQADVPGAIPTGVVSSITVAEEDLVGEVEVDLTIDTLDVGRLAATLTHDGKFASLINRVGMDERGSVGLVKNNLEITLDDDAPAADDAHEEPALGSEEFFGPHQPDGRGEFIGDAITSDDRDNMMFQLAGVDSDGQWDLFVADYRIQGATAAHSIFRRWAMTIKSPCGCELYAGTAMDLPPGAGICTIDLAGGAINLSVNASFTPGDHVVDYEVVLIDPSVPGSGTLEITDCATNVTYVPISLAEEVGDVDLPVLTGSVNPATFEFEGTATDDQPTDTGIASIELAPYATNLQIVSMTPDPPAAASSVDFVVGLVDPGANGRGYIRAVDDCGLRSFILVEIDAVGPVCSGSVGLTKRYVSGDELPADIPDNDPYGGGATSTIIVPDADIVEDINITFNITHPMDDDVEMTLISSTVLSLFSDIGSTGNDFIDTTLDDEAAIPIPDSYSEAPFTGSYQPEGGPALFALDGQSAARLYTLQVIDDAAYNIGTFDSWSLTIESLTFPERYDGRAEDSEAHDTGICSIELLPGAEGLALLTDPFDPGDPIVRYSVELARGSADRGGGSGTVRVTDCAGNSCDVPVVLVSEVEPPLPEGAIVCDDDGDCSNLSTCIEGVCYVQKNRYLSFTPQNDGEATAVRVKHVDSGSFWWVGEPNVEGRARLHSALDPSLYRDWSLGPPVIHAGDCAVVPGEVYEVQAIDVGGNPANESDYSEALTLPTSADWGDVAGPTEEGLPTPPDGSVGLADVLAAIAYYQASPTAPPVTWVDVSPQIPDATVNVGDILGIIGGYQSEDYPYSAPEECP